VAFDIRFVGEEFEEEGQRLRQIMLTIGSFKESIDADMTHWSIGDYRDQWMNELRKVIGPPAKGALITSLPDPNFAYRVNTWPMWREGDEIFFQSRLGGMLEPYPRFQLDRLDEFIGERMRVNEDGVAISEWSVPMSEVVAFINR